jgi:hypothetical protein
MGHADVDDHRGPVDDRNVLPLPIAVNVSRFSESGDRQMTPNAIQAVTEVT